MDLPMRGYTPLCLLLIDAHGARDVANARSAADLGSEADGFPACGGAKRQVAVMADPRQSRPRTSPALGCRNPSTSMLVAGTPWKETDAMRSE
jgi:hypothetical protein